jgi:hypothetical protein
VRLCWSNKTAPAHLSLAGWSHGWRGRGVDDNDKIHPKAPFLDLEMMGEGGGNGASCMVGGAGVGGNEKEDVKSS